MRLLSFLLVALILFPPVPALAESVEELVTGITLETRSITLGLDQDNRSATLNVKKFVRVSGNASPPSAISWLSSDSAVVRVTPGRVGSAIVSVGSSGQPGSAVISVSAGRASASCTVHVKQTVRATGVKFGRKSYAVALGSGGVREMIQPALVFSPSTASAGQPGRDLVRYSSSNRRVVSVDERGVVSVHKPGSVTITAQLLDGSKKRASCRYVVKPVEIEKLTLLPASVQVGGRAMLRVLVEPEDAIAPAIKFSSANAKRVHVGKGGLITGLRAGRTSVRAVAGRVKASVAVGVGDGNGAGGAVTNQFLGIGNANYAGMMPQPASLSAATKLGELYAEAGFGGSAVRSGVAHDLSASGIERALAAFANDPSLSVHSVSVLFYAGYALDPGQSGGDHGLLGVDGVGVSIERVRALLDRVPGRVVVILDCDMAGRFIGAEFAKRARKAFAARSLTDSKIRDKYKILVSCGGDGRAYVLGDGDDARWLFSGALIDGLGDGRPADRNRDGIASLEECRAYISDAISPVLARYGYAQQIQAWPAGDNSAIYSKN